MAFSLAADVYIGDTMVRIRCAGTGRPLLMLHDLGGSGADFAPLTSDTVAAGREAVAPDLPGFAQSDPIEGDLGDLVLYLQEFADQTIKDPIDVVGRGFGGYLALSLAAIRPDRYERLILIDPLTPPLAGGKANTRMGLGMALNGAYTTVRRGRILQNVAGFSRAKNLLELASQPDQIWWNSLPAIAARSLLVDLGGGRSVDRHRYRNLMETLPGISQTVVSGKDAESKLAAVVLGFVS